MSEAQVQARRNQADERPLTQQEFVLLQRLLSDPFSIPMQFKTWIVSYLETSTITFPKSSILGLTGSIRALAQRQEELAPRVGTIVISALDGHDTPPGTLRCDGGSYLRAEHPRLFEAIGTRFGAADGNHFNVPSLSAGPIPALFHVDFNIVT